MSSKSQTLRFYIYCRLKIFLLWIIDFLLKQTEQMKISKQTTYISLVCGGDAFLLSV